MFCCLCLFWTGCFVVVGELGLFVICCYFCYCVCMCVFYFVLLFCCFWVVALLLLFFNYYYFLIIKQLYWIRLTLKCEV